MKPTQPSWSCYPGGTGECPDHQQCYDLGNDLGAGEIAQRGLVGGVGSVVIRSATASADRPGSGSTPISCGK